MSNNVFVVVVSDNVSDNDHGIRLSSASEYNNIMFHYAPHL